MRLHRTIALTAASFVLVAPAPALAYHDEHANHACPIPPPKVQYHFARDFVSPWDDESRSKAYAEECDGKPWRVAGFGGRPFRPEPGEKKIRARHCHHVARRPVIFVHGNNVDAGDWYPVLSQFRKAGFSMCRLWGLGYNGVGGNNGEALYTRNPRAHDERGDNGNTTRITGNDINLPDVEGFIRRVLAYTGAKRFDIVSHSLGVTLARKVLKLNPDLLARVDSFVGIAGGNHGTTFCRGNEAFLLSDDPHRAVIDCDEIAPDFPGYTNPWLHALNTPDETPGDVRYMTVYDGTGEGDPAFAGQDAPNPRLEGAINCTFPHAYHNDLRVDPAIVNVYIHFLKHKPLPEVEPGATPATAQGGSCEPPAKESAQDTQRPR